MLDRSVVVWNWLTLDVQTGRLAKTEGPESAVSGSVEVAVQSDSGEGHLNQFAASVKGRDACFCFLWLFSSFTESKTELESSENYNESSVESVSVATKNRSDSARFAAKLSRVVTEQRNA